MCTTVTALLNLIGLLVSVDVKQQKLTTALTNTALSTGPVADAQLLPFIFLSLLLVLRDVDRRGDGWDGLFIER